ncbi:MAG: hypothetical protein Fur0039_09950 [Rhodocyclaceae bacterium]
MGKTTLKPALAAAAVALAMSSFGASAQAAGLGKLRVMSGLGEPLRAELDLVASQEELSSMAARLAPAAAFAQAGVEFAPVLGSLRLSLATRADGKAVIRMSTDRPVNDPFLDILVELNWAAGRLVREYTFLLDPPVAAPVQAPVATAQVAEPKPVQARPLGPVAEAAAVKPELGATHEVRRGETLHGIASAARSEGVALDQMLVAIFRANPGAFDGNMNRLRAGRILKIPQPEAAAAIPAPEARRVVLAQAADFGAYRKSLAKAVQAAPAPSEEPARQAAAGKLAPRVEEKAAPAAPAGDQLKVSKAEAAGRAPAAETARGGDRASQARITALEEDLLAKEKALKEANARLAELEKSVREMQQLIELKNQSLAQIQGKAGGPEAPVRAAEPAPPAAPAGAPAAAPPAAQKPAEPPRAAAQPAAAEPGLLSDLLSGPLGWGLGALILAILGAFGYRMRKQRAEAGATGVGGTTAPVAESSFRAAGGQSVDTASSSIQTDFSQSGLSAVDTEEGVDPVAEADVYMAYGRDAQAEEILLDALKSEPARYAIHVKLLEIYAQRKDVKRFESLAGELHAATGGKGADWDKAAAMGRKLDPANPLFGGAAPAQAEETRFTEKTIVVSSPERLRDTWTSPTELGRISAAVSGGQEDKTVVLPAAELGGAGSGVDLGIDLATPGQPETPAAVDFDLGLDFSATLSTPRPAASLAADKTVRLEPGAGKPVDLPLDAGAAQPDAAAGMPPMDFELQPPTLAPSEPKAPPALDLEATDIGGSVIDFDLDQERVPKAPAAQVVDLEKTDIGENVMQIPEPQAGRPAGAAVVDLEKTDFGGNVLDFDFKLEESQGGVKQPPAAPDATVDLSTINLDLSAPEAAPEQAATQASTKIDLARAYEEMGDKEGARELLDEVIKEGSAAEQQRAREMLARLS